MALKDYLIDGAQSAGTIAQNIFDGMTKNNIPLNKAGNFGSQFMMLGKGLLGADAGQIETYEQKEYLKNIMMNRMRETGETRGNQIGYTDYDPAASWSDPNTQGKGFLQELNAGAGYSSPNAAYQNTLGAAGFNVPETGGQANFDKSGTLFDFTGNTYGLRNINKGGLFGTKQSYTPEINITPTDIQDVFGGGKLVHKGEGIQDRPEINSLNLDRLKQERKAKEQSQILTDQSRRQQGQISKPPLAVVTPQTPQVPKQVGMMSSGPKRRSSRGGRKKAVAKPSRSNYSRKYNRLVGGR
jgi:hypothetical protein